MIGEKKFSLKKSEKVNLSQRRSIFSIKDINAGEKLTSLNISSFRPSIGINSNLFFKVLGRKAKKKKIHSLIRKIIYFKLIYIDIYANTSAMETSNTTYKETIVLFLT